MAIALSNILHESSGSEAKVGLTLTTSGNYATNGYQLFASAIGLAMIHSGVVTIGDGYSCDIIPAADGSYVMLVVYASAGVEVTNATPLAIAFGLQIFGV